MKGASIIHVDKLWVRDDFALCCSQFSTHFCIKKKKSKHGHLLIVIASHDDIFYQWVVGIM
jgi:hypothetical protein